jgi:thiamine kinase-like enzyme
LNIRQDKSASEDEKILHTTITSAIIGYLANQCLNMHMQVSLQLAIEQIQKKHRLAPIRVYRLSDGLTNENFRAEIECDTYVISVFGERSLKLGIDRDVEYHNARLAFEQGIGPEVIIRVPGALVSRFVEGQRLSPGDLSAGKILRQVVKTVSRCHSIPAKQGYGSYDVFCAVDNHLRSSQSRHHFAPSFQRIRHQLERIKRSFRKQAGVPVFCHNDTVPENMILTANGLILIDWEYAGVGDRFFDLGMLAAYHKLDQTQEETLLKAYFGKCTAGALARLRLMRIMSDLRDATWGMVQAQVSALEFDYIDYSNQRFQRFIRATSKPKFTTWLDLAASRTRLRPKRKEPHV